MMKKALKPLTVIGSLLIILILFSSCSSGDSSKTAEDTPAATVTSTAGLLLKTGDKLGLTPEEGNYAVVSTAQRKILYAAIDELDLLLQKPKNGDSEWESCVNIQLEKFHEVYNEVAKLTPPDSLKDIHQKQVEALKHYDSFASLFAQGIEKKDPKLTKQGEEELEIGSQLYIEASNLLSKFLLAHKVTP